MEARGREGGGAGECLLCVSLARSLVPTAPPPHHHHRYYLLTLTLVVAPSHYSTPHKRLLHLHSTVLGPPHALLLPPQNTSGDPAQVVQSVHLLGLAQCFNRCR